VDACIPTVVTLHNFRLNCAAGTLFRDTNICEKCWGGAPWPAIRHRCYQRSFLASAAAVRAQLAYRDLIKRGLWIDQYIALTEFAREKHVQIGIPSERIAVKGNSVLDPPQMGAGAGEYALFVGRLGPEKGIQTILQAWQLMGSGAPKLSMVGEGPLEQEILSRRSTFNLNIDLLGAQPRSSVMELMKNARMLVFASRWYEGFPLVIAESLACGTPVLGSRIGGIPELIVDGFSGALFPPGNAEALAQGVLRLSQLLESNANIRANCRTEFERRHSPGQNTRALVEIYNTVLERNG
jgi:glycosyltransferase involved in cell wall biosynthesis